MKSGTVVFERFLTASIAAIGMLACTPVGASICLAQLENELIRHPSLIFYGRVESAEACTEGRTVSHYKILTLYKGFVESDSVEIEGGGFDCSPAEVGATLFVLAGYSSKGEGSRANYFQLDCSIWQFNNDVTVPLPRLDRYRLSLQRALKEVDRNSKSVVAWKKVLTLQQAQNDHVGALRSIASLREMDPKSQDYVIHYADSLASLDENEQALAAYDLALTLGSDNKRIQRGRIRALISMDRFAETDPRWLDFSDLSVESADFSNRTLNNATFSRSKLHESRFRGANLAGASFELAYLDNVDLSEANLQAANMQSISTNEVLLARANLSNSDLRRASLYGADLRNANLTGSDLTGATLDKADLTGADLRGAKLKLTRFIEAGLPGADLSGKDLRAVQFQGADLRNAKLVGADLRGAFFSGLEGRFRTENSTGRSMQADLRGADLTDAVIWGADLSSVRYDCHTKFPAGVNLKRLELVSSPGCPSPP